MRLAFAVILLASAAAPGREKPERWLEVRSPHFTVVSNSSEKQARQVADQFERIRSVFRAAFPRASVDPASPITVFAVKDEKSFRALEPDAWLAKGQARRTGLFQRGPERNYVLMQLDAEGDHPYAVVYHEYTHLLASPFAQWLPLWFDEGLAEFYENTEIRNKEVWLGRPSEGNIELLRENRLLPLATLFAVDHSSPYYNEEHKGSIFYAESWALVHDLTFEDRKHGTRRLTDYLDLVSSGVDPTAAAVRAFGELKPLERALESYVHQASFDYFRMAGATDVDDDAFSERTLTPAQADAARAGLLVYDGRYLDARSLLEDVLRDDPRSVAAREDMGLLESQQGHTEKAEKWFEQAVELDSQSYFAHYYFAAMAMRSSLDDATAARVERSLRIATKVKPDFAPAYDRLAVLYATRHERLDEAHMLELNAVTLDPGSFGYRLNTAGILMAMDRPRDAAMVARGALHLAKSPEERASAETLLTQAQARQAFEERQAEYAREQTPQLTLAPSEQTSAQDPAQEKAPPVLRHRDEGPPRGPRRAVEGTIEDVQCSLPSALDLKIVAGDRVVDLHSDNYFRVIFTAANFTPRGVIRPCRDIQGMRARAVFVGPRDSSQAGASGQRGDLVSLELSR